MASHSRCESANGDSSSTDPPATKCDRLGPVEDQRPGGAAGGLADLDQPEPAGQLARDVDGHRLAGGQAPVDGGGHGGRRVDDEQVAGVEEVGEVAEAGVDRGRLADRHHQAHVVPAAAAGLGRLVGLVGRVEGEAGRRCDGARRGHERRSRRDRRGGRGLAPVAAAGLVAVDQGEQPGHARPRAAAGRRCPRRGRRPGASRCAGRRGRPRAPGARGARRPAPGRRAPAPPSTRRRPPALVGLDRGVGGDVDDRAAGRRGRRAAPRPAARGAMTFTSKVRRGHRRSSCVERPAAGWRRACWRCSPPGETGPGRSRRRRRARRGGPGR